MTDTLLTETLPIAVIGAGPGVCGGEASAEGGGCCGGPAPAGLDACCLKDAEAKASGESGCGCGARPADPAPQPVVAAGACCGV